MLISDRAFKRIEELLGEAKDYLAANKLDPIIMWIFNRTGEASNPGPVLGLIEHEKALKEKDTYSRNGIVVYNGLPADLQAEFEGHTLDFRDGHFDFFIDVRPGGPGGAA